MPSNFQGPGRTAVESSSEQTPGIITVRAAPAHASPGDGYNAARPIPAQKDLPPEDFGIAIICALPLEMDAVHEELDSPVVHVYPQAPNDPHVYSWGVMGGHPTILLLPKERGILNAGLAAQSSKTKFPNLHLTLLVGVCGGVPCQEPDVRLGDVIISSWVARFISPRFGPPGQLETHDISNRQKQPHPKIAQMVRMLELKKFRKELLKNANDSLQELQRSETEYTLLGVAPDLVFSPDYHHIHRPALLDGETGVKCKCSTKSGAQCDVARESSCKDLGCAQEKATGRARDNFQIHVGGYASEDIVMRNPGTRDQLGGKGVLAFEMEASGVWELDRALVIKGVCDYADSHKNKTWQSYAAGAAACVAKAFIRKYYPLKATAYFCTEEPGQVAASPASVSDQRDPVNPKPGLYEHPFGSLQPVRRQPSVKVPSAALYFLEKWYHSSSGTSNAVFCGRDYNQWLGLAISHIAHSLLRKGEVVIYFRVSRNEASGVSKLVQLFYTMLGQDLGSTGDCVQQEIEDFLGIFGQDSPPIVIFLLGIGGLPIGETKDGGGFRQFLDALLRSPRFKVLVSTEGRLLQGINKSYICNIEGMKSARAPMIL